MDFDINSRNSDNYIDIGGKPVKRVANIELTPTAQTNGSLVLTYDGSNQVTNIALTIGATTYNKVLTWVAGNCTNISVWS